RDTQLFNTWMIQAPLHHSIRQMPLDILGHLLEEGRGGASASWTRCDLWCEMSDAERLQDLLRSLHLLGAIAARPGSERDTNGVADSLTEQDAQAQRAGHLPLHSHPRLGEAKVQRKIGAR